MESNLTTIPTNLNAQIATKKRQSASFWVAFQRSAGGGIRREKKSKLTGLPVTEWGRYFVYYRDGGGKSITNGKGGYDSKNEAKAALGEFRKSISSGTSTHQIAQKLENDEKLTIPSLIGEFLRIKKPSVKRIRTFINYENKLPKLVAYLASKGKPNLKINDFAKENGETTLEAFDFKDWLITEGRGGSGHNNGGARGIITVVKAFFNWCKDKRYYMGPNPFTLKNAGGDTVLSKNVLPFTHTPYYLSDQEIRVLFEAIRINVERSKKAGKCACSTCTKRRQNRKKEERVYYPTAPRLVQQRKDLAEIVLVALHSGMREGELVRMERGWINFINDNDCLITIPANVAKSGKARGILIEGHPEILAILKRSGPIWPGWDESRLIQAIGRVIDRAQKFLGFKGELSTHDLRHTSAKLYLENGGTLQDLKDRMGHESIATTMIYRAFENRAAQGIVSRRIQIDTTPLLKIVD